MTPKEYLDTYNLWDLETLKAHAQEKSVYVIESPRFPSLAMLHYKDECQYDNLWTDFSLFSRGLLLDLKNKKVLHWGYSKFFNIDQYPNVAYDILKNKGPFEISEKIDGSYILLMQDPNTNNFHCLTKGSMDSDHGLYATSIMPDMLKNEKLVNKFSLIFELIDKQFQIVVNYEKKGYKSGLYLTGARDKETNRLLPYSEIVLLAKELGLPCIKTYSFKSLDHLIEESKNLSILDEGFVLRWEPELLVKIKSPKYLEMHRFISNLSDKNILEAVSNRTDSLLLEVCPEEYYKDVELKINEFKTKNWNFINTCYLYYKDAPKDSRKSLALWLKANVPPKFIPFVFEIDSGKNIDLKWVYKVIGELEKVSGKTKI